MAKKREWDNDEPEQVAIIDDMPLPETPIPQKPKIPFEHWVGKLVKAGKIRWYDDDALLIFLKNQGLSKNEDEDTYNKAFEKF